MNLPGILKRTEILMHQKYLNYEIMIYVFSWEKTYFKEMFWSSLVKSKLRWMLIERENFEKVFIAKYFFSRYTSNTKVWVIFVSRKGSFYLEKFV